MVFHHLLRSLRKGSRNSMDLGFTPAFDLRSKSSGPSHLDKDIARSSDMAGSSDAKMAAIPEVDIDASGRFKYILLKLWSPTHKDEEDFKYLVRGYSWAGFHADIYDDVFERVSPLGLELECVGGGRILHEPDKKTIFVYGYSQGYGRAKHSVVCDILRKKYGHYDKIHWSDEGY